MLEIHRIAASIDDLAEETVRRAQIAGRQTLSALTLIDQEPGAWAPICQRIRDANPSWLAAEPLSDHPLRAALVNAPAAPFDGIYSAVAADGSQIPLDRHEIAACYVLSVGSVALHYGTGERAKLSSSAVLKYLDSDIFADIDGGEGRYVGEREIADARYMAELDAVADLAESCAGRNSAVAFLDGTLIRWQQEAQSGQRRSDVIEKLTATLDRCRRVGVPLISYLSRPASREVLGALRIALCPHAVVEGPDCACGIDPHAPCRSLDRLRDGDLFLRILEPGRRSGIFASRSKVLSSYKPAHNKIGFFYYRAGTEIARIEAPMWVLKDAELLNRVHGAVHDQVGKGRGYPICLTEAHEQAVVRGADRDAFYHLVERSLIRNGLPANRTAKAVSKRRAPI